MSLLLDALKSTDSSAAMAVEPEEEPLDAQATLELLAQRPTAQARLALVPTPDVAVAPSSDFAPELVSEVVPATPCPEPAPLSIVGRPDEIAAAPPATAPPNARSDLAAPNARASLAAPPTKSRSKKYGLLLAAVATLAGIGIVGKSLWPLFGSNTVIYPQRRESQQTAASTDPAPAPSTGAVQVSSARPADQFAYSGNAPEIDLRDAEITPAVTSEPAATGAAAPPTSVAPSAAQTASVAAKYTTGPAPAESSGVAARTGEIRPSSMRPTVTRSAATHSSAPTLSVTRTEGPSSIDRHVELGYRALAAGNVATAQNEYVAALELDPNNVDAMLGMATVAARDGRSKAAAAAYANVLKLEPGNPDATAAMAMLGSNGSAGESNESRLKILIAGDDGGRPSLHAALGGVYAADARWTEAAQEYFVALGKDPGNPDLAFNVAASLDQNRNPAVALTFYGQALAFARQRPTQIDLNAIEQRIGQLQARGEVHAPGAPGAP
jgi:Flp pilus assembly protein TadD